MLSTYLSYRIGSATPYLIEDRSLASSGSSFYIMLLAERVMFMMSGFDVLVVLGLLDDEFAGFEVFKGFFVGLEIVVLSPYISNSLITWVYSS
jgi:hypothetical protein